MILFNEAAVPACLTLNVRASDPVMYASVRNEVISKTWTDAPIRA